MRVEDIALLADTTYTLLRCSALFRFISTKREYLHLERLIAKGICDRLDLCIEGQAIDPNLPKPSGKIYVLKFRPFEIQGFEHEHTFHEQPVIRFELEYQYYSKKRDSIQSMIMIPAKTIPSSESSKEFWYYPLIMSKLSLPVLEVITRVFERHFHAYISPLHVAPYLLESVIQYYAASCCEPLLDDDMYIGEYTRGVKTDPVLRLEYTTDEEEIKTIKTNIRPNQIQKICSLGNGSTDEFYTMFRTHIRNSTKINLGTFLLNSVSCSIVSLSRTDKLKIHRAAPKPYVFLILEDLLQLASKAQQ